MFRDLFDGFMNGLDRSYGDEDGEPRQHNPNRPRRFEDPFVNAGQTYMNNLY